MKPSRIVAVWILFVSWSPPAFAVSPALITLCTWNLEHLAAQNGTGCRPRQSSDYRALRNYVASLKADIIAFQEVENRAAALRVFDPAAYRLEISNRPDVDLGRCREGNRKRLMQRTGFAIRNDLAEKHGVSYSRLPDVRTLAVSPSERWGVHIVLTITRTEAGHGDAPEILHLLSVHLKAGCAYKPVVYKNDGSPCSRLAAQVSRLEAWMDARAMAGEEFVILGDMNRQLDGLGDSVWENLDDSEICTWVPSGSGLWYCRKDSVRYSRIADIERARAGRKHPYPHHPRHPFAIDHIIMSAAADWMAIEPTARFIRDDQRLSDHTPLVMQFDLFQRAWKPGVFY